MTVKAAFSNCPAGSSRSPAIPALPCSVGVGLKAAHYLDALSDNRGPAFVEVHAENYLHAGGPAHRHLTAIRSKYRLSLHGVGLSLGGPTPPETAQLAARRALIQRYQPDQFSEHLAWTGIGGTYFNDLLPVAYSPDTLARVVEHLDATQNALGVRILIENPSTYLQYSRSSYSEPQFLAELVRRSGCGLLLDVNNIVVSAANHGLDAYQYLRDLPLNAVGEIHLAGHRECQDSQGRSVLIDSHDGPVQQPTWDLFRELLQRAGTRPTLIEWDNNLPSWHGLLQQADLAQSEMNAFIGKQHAAS
jgi:uncharacterized protein (UPF0276 family)